MSQRKGQKTRQKPDGDESEMRVVGIDFKPAPDAEERLRRLFTILFELVGEHPPTLEAETLPNGGSKERDTGQSHGLNKERE